MCACVCMGVFWGIWKSPDFGVGSRALFVGGSHCSFDVALSRRKRVRCVFWVFVHIRCLGDGLYRFRSYSESLLIDPEAGPVKSNQNALAPPLGASLRLGMPAHGFKPACGQRGLTGRFSDQEQIKSKSTAA